MEKPQTSSIQKAHPKYNNINKMKRQRNIQQVKEMINAHQTKQKRRR